MSAILQRPQTHVRAERTLPYLLSEFISIHSQLSLNLLRQVLGLIS